jgi:von Willebrand factor type A domain-containing protein
VLPVVGRRHASTVDRPPSKGVTGTVLTSTLAIITAGVAYLLLGTPSQLSCTGQLTLTVHAERVVAPALRAAADRLRSDNASADGNCISAVVHDRDPATVTVQLTRAATIEAEADVPDVWVPDSSMWLGIMRGRAQTRSAVPATGVSLAASPVVVAMTRPVAAAFGKARPGWAQLLDRLSGRRPLAVGMPDPASAATGIAALHGLSGALAKRKAPARTWTATWRALAVNTVPNVGELIRRVPAAPARPGLHAFPADEAAVWRFNRGRPQVPLVAVYPADGALRLDYPYVVLPGTAAVPTKSQAAQTLLREATSPRGNGDLFAAGLRLPDGTPGRQFDAVPGVNRRVPRLLDDPPAARIASLIRQWTVANLKARTLVLVDVSGSMDQQVPGTGGATRMQLTIRAAREGLGLFEDDTVLGVWVFSTKLTRTTDYREVIPLGKLSERLGDGTRRSETTAALDRLRAKPGGATGLYDSIRAAFRAVRASYDPTRVNSIVVLTDGRNEDPESVTLAQLVKELRASADPKRPIPVITVALGPDVDMRPLRLVAQVTGGATYQAKDPRQISQVFFDAVSQRTCRPNC